MRAGAHPPHGWGDYVSHKGVLRFDNIGLSVLPCKTFLKDSFAVDDDQLWRCERAKAAARAAHFETVQCSSRRDRALLSARFTTTLPTTPIPPKTPPLLNTSVYPSPTSRERSASPPPPAQSLVNPLLSPTSTESRKRPSPDGLEGQCTGSDVIAHAPDVPELVAVVNMCKTERYYDPHTLRSEGIQYYWFQAEGHGTAPDARSLVDFSKLIFFISKQFTHVKNPCVAVHCTHGSNRTGTYLCFLMMAFEGLTSESAIQAFTEARGESISRVEMIQFLTSVDQTVIAPLTLAAESTSMIEQPNGDDGEQGKEEVDESRERGDWDGGGVGEEVAVPKRNPQNVLIRMINELFEMIKVSQVEDRSRALYVSDLPLEMVCVEDVALALIVAGEVNRLLHTIDIIEFDQNQWVGQARITQMNQVPVECEELRLKPHKPVGRMWSRRPLFPSKSFSAYEWTQHHPTHYHHHQPYSNNSDHRPRHHNNGPNHSYRQQGHRFDSQRRPPPPPVQGDGGPGHPKRGGNGRKEHHYPHQGYEWVHHQDHRAHNHDRSAGHRAYPHHSNVTWCNPVKQDQADENEKRQRKH
eukprot:GHVN01059596.1.p1 GENE.GHVN01059596.1~~GHVN01059596.1.p1  ORF type:complete len:581 (+),score=104.32 GHVN01059596.1:916-2658(+)